LHTQKKSYIGKSMPRVDAKLKVTGQARFGADTSLPGMLHGKVLRSPYPHARILNIDTSRAERLPGVRAVVTAEDTPKIPFGFSPANHDKYPLANEIVRYVGDEVAGVAAIDEDTAKEALELIEVEYEPLPPVFDPVISMQEGSPQLHAHMARNISAQTHMNFGDVDRGFKESDYIREDVFNTQAIIHGFIEPHAVVGQWDSTGKVTIWAPKQSPYITYRHMARALALPLSKIRVIQTYVGGGFGGKHDPFGLDFAAVLLSRKTGGLPVKIVIEQEEVFFSGIRRHPMQIKIKTGVKKDGTLMATACEVIADGGGYVGIGEVTIFLNGAFLTLPLRLPNVKYDAYRIYTNKPWSGALRGHGIPQIRFAYESQLDIIAEDLSMDPVSIRLKNAVQPGEETGNGFKVRTCGLTESIEQCLDISDFQNKRDQKEEQGVKRRGVGLACNSMCSGGRLSGHDANTIIIKMLEDGRVVLMTGSTDVGQGCCTVLAQIVADHLGIAVEEIEVPNVDTEITPLDSGVFGSRVTYTSGNAAMKACQEVKKQLLGAVAEQFKVQPEELEIGDHCIYLKADPSKVMPLVKAVRAAYYGKGQPVIGVGTFMPGTEKPDWKKGTGNMSTEYSFGTQVAEVEVDTETGEVTLLKMYLTHDCGVPVNPLMMEGQLEGSVVQGLAQVCMEELPHQEGLTFSTNFMDYGMPTAKDVPGEYKFGHVITGTAEEGIFKEAGEGTMISTIPAICNAIYDAVGVRIKELPITAEGILKALEAKKTAKEGV